MINCIKNTDTYNSLNLSKQKFHAYLFYSNDKELNNNVALTFAKSLICTNYSICNTCKECKQFDALTHPDVILINQDSIKVEDANSIISKQSTLPVSASCKVFIVLNAENINELAQNKLLKSIEEPNPSNVFIFTTTKTDKLLPTILSRLNKLFVPTLSSQDKILIAKELKENGIDIFKHINSVLSLTEMLNMESNKLYASTIQSIHKMLTELKTTQDIPKVVTGLGEVDKNLFLPLLQNIFLCALNNENKFSTELLTLVKFNFSNKAILKCLPLIEEAYKKQMANVNFSYILDNLLFNILKEKFLCKQ